MFALRCILSLAAATSALAGPADAYKGTQVIRVPASNSTQLELINGIIDRLSLSTWHSVPNSFVDVVIPQAQTEAFANDLSVLQLETMVMHADLGASIIAESAGTPVASNARAVLVTDAWFNAYQTYDNHIAYIKELAETYPANSESFTIGSSVQGRVLTGINIFGSGGSGTKPALIFLGTVHAREWVSTMVTEYIAYKLLTDTSVKTLLDKYDIYILPISNPDGFVYSQTSDRLWRKNRTPAPSGSTCVGVDMNRNFNIKWSQTGGASTNPCAQDYKGTGVASTPEVKALQDFITSKGTSAVGGKVFIDYHSYGNYMLTPYGYSATVPPTNAAIQTVAQGYAAAVKGVSGTTLTVGPAGITLYPTTGSSDDFSFDVGKFKYTFTNELRDTGRYGFVLPASQISPTGAEVFAGVKYLLTTTL